MDSLFSQVASSSVYPLHNTLTTGIVFLLIVFSARSSILIGCSGIVRLGWTLGWFVSITASGSDMNFLNWDIWNALCTSNRLRGSASRYAMGPIYSNTSYGLIYLQRMYVSHNYTLPTLSTSSFTHTNLGLSFPLTPNL